MYCSPQKIKKKYCYMYIYFSLALSFAASSLLLLLCLLIMRFRRHVCCLCPAADVEHQWDPPQEQHVEKGDKEAAVAVRVFKWEEVERLTGNFTAGVIGEGGFSTVYVGRLPDSGEVTVAAFKVQHSSERLYRAFLQERDVLLRVKHDNIVRFIGYSDDYEQGVLVFEYITNGTLHDKLHTLTPAAPPLPWSYRVSILFQIAEAVDYLHDGCDLQIVHGDLTSSNVLLDSNLNPKLCDFGFARMGFSAAILPAPSGYMVGSPGCADPHYLRTGVISKKSDVYSFGVLIFEMVSGIPAVGSDGRFLTAVIKGRVGDLVDPLLCGEYDVGELEIMGDVAGRCVGELETRPSMGEVVRIMREKVNIVKM